jgi:hypothetical protein
VAGRGHEDLEFDLDWFLARPLMAHLATASPAGPRESPLWFLWEDGALWFVGNGRDSFPGRLVKDPRCAAGIVDFDLAQGRLLHVGMRGEAELVPLDQGRLHRLLRRYLGDDRASWNSRFRNSVVDELELMVRFVPTSVVARDQSYFAAGDST